MIQLSVLIPSIPSRIAKMTALYTKLLGQCEHYPVVEVICLVDNKKRSIGQKRDALVQIAKGKYLTFVDDDDDIAEDYIQEIMEAIKKGKNTDLIVFQQRATINGMVSTIDFDFDHENEEFKPNELTKRQPFHVCVWKSVLAKEHRYKDVSYSEDWDWSKRVLNNVHTQYKIPKVLHYYHYNDQQTEANAQSNEIFKNRDDKSQRNITGRVIGGKKK